MASFFCAQGLQSAQRPTATFTHCSLLLVKPHAVASGLCGKIVGEVASAGFEVSALGMFNLDRVAAKEFLEVYDNVVPDYSKYVSELSSGNCLALEVRHADNVVQRLRDLAG